MQFVSLIFPSGTNLSMRYLHESAAESMLSEELTRRVGMSRVRNG